MKRGIIKTEKGTGRMNYLIEPIFQDSTSSIWIEDISNLTQEDEGKIVEYELIESKHFPEKMVARVKEGFTLRIDDGICKGFKNEDEVDLFINKAYDEDTDTHALLIFIPKIPSHNIMAVQQPLFYKDEAEREKVYTDLDSSFVDLFWHHLINQIEEQRKNQNNGSDTSEG